MISVIIPLFNAEKSIINTLNSIKNQTWKGEFEVLIVNDGSTDKSKSLVENFCSENLELNIHLINQENGGVSKARNTALQLAKGAFIAFLDADDEWFPEKTSIQIKILQEQSDTVDFLSCRRTNHKILWPYSVKEGNLAPITFRKLMIRNEVQPSTVIFKRAILDKIGYFDDAQKYAEDINYWLKISEHFKMFILNQELVVAGGGKRTFGITGLSANLSEMEKGFQKNLREMHQSKRIGAVQFSAYEVFYKMKYMIRLTRDRYLKFRGE